MLSIFLAGAIIRVSQDRPSTDGLASVSNEALIRRVTKTVNLQCSRCHTGTAGAVFSFRTAANLYRYARGITGEVLGQRMPPGVVVSSLDHFLPQRPLTPTNVAEIWEWGNRVEKGLISAADISESMNSGTTEPMRRPAPTVEISLPISVPAEGSGGVTPFPFRASIPPQYRNRAVTGFWVSSDLPGRVVRARLALETIQLGWSFGNRPWHSTNDGPRMPREVSGQLELLPDGETHHGTARLIFILGAVAPASPAVQFRNVSQLIRVSGRVETMLDAPISLYGFHPNFSDQLESWEATAAQGESARIRLASQPAAVCRSIGTYYLAQPLKLPSGSRLGMVVQYRRNHRDPISVDWLVKK